MRNKSHSLFFLAARARWIASWILLILDLLLSCSVVCQQRILNRNYLMEFKLQSVHEFLPFNMSPFLQTLQPVAGICHLSTVNCRNRSSGNGPEPIQTLVLPSVMSESLSVMSEFPRGTCGRIEEKKDRIRNARFFKQSIMLTFNRVFNPAISLTLFIQSLNARKQEAK